MAVVLCRAGDWVCIGGGWVGPAVFLPQLASPPPRNSDLLPRDWLPCQSCYPLVWSPGGGGGRFLLAVPPGDWSAPPPAAGTPPSQQTGSQQATGEAALISPRGYRDPSTS